MTYNNLVTINGTDIILPNIGSYMIHLSLSALRITYLNYEVYVADVYNKYMYCNFRFQPIITDSTQTLKITSILKTTQVNTRIQFIGSYEGIIYNETFSYLIIHQLT